MQSLQFSYNGKSYLVPSEAAVNGFCLIPDGTLMYLNIDDAPGHPVIKSAKPTDARWPSAPQAQELGFSSTVG